MTDTPEYKTKTIDLPKGIRIDGILHKGVTIREQTVGDIVYTVGQDKSPLQSALEQMGRRVVQLGGFKHPGVDLLEKLSPEDFDAISVAAAEMDGYDTKTASAKKK